MPKSLRHSCRSELTRQGISLSSPHVAMRQGPYLQLSGRRRVGWRMASGDSRKRDGFRVFIVCTIVTIRVMPWIDRWRPNSISRTICANFRKSSAFAVLSGCSSKNGMMRLTKELLQLVQNAHAPLPLDDNEGWLSLPTNSIRPGSGRSEH